MHVADSSKQIFECKMSTEGFHIQNVLEPQSQKFRLIPMKPEINKESRMVCLRNRKAVAKI